MLIFSQDGEKVFDTTGGYIYIEPLHTDKHLITAHSAPPDTDEEKYSVYGVNCMGSCRLATTDSLQSAKNIIKVINAMTILGIPTVDLDDDIDTIVSAYEENKDKIYFDKYLGSIISKILMR